MSIERGPSPEEMGIKTEASEQESSKKLSGQVKEMAVGFNLPSEQLKELGFNKEAEAKAGKERAEQLLNGQISNLIKRVSSSEHPAVEAVKFRLPDYMSPDNIHYYDLQDAFSARANTINEEGKRIPRRILGDKQLKLISISRERREGGYYTSEVTWTLGLDPYNPEKEAKSQSL